MAGSPRRIAALARHNAVLRLRDPGQFVSYLVMPMVLMLALKPVYQRAVTGGTMQITTGMLVIFSVLALSVVGTAMLTERSWHTWDRLRSTRASIPELLLGKALPVYAALLLQQTILLLYGITVIGVRPRGAYWLLAVAVAVWGATLLAIGAALAAVVRSHGQLSAICDVGALVLTTIGGAFVPTTMFPHWLQAVAPVSPGYWALTMLQAALRGDVAGTLAPAVILLLVGTAVGVFACWRLAHGWGRATLL
jgi:ABC-2 type transport system permease protein